MLALVTLHHYISIDWIWGGKDLPVTADQARRYESDPRGVIAEVLGVPFSAYQEWLELNGRVRCQAKTGRGRQCKSNVPGVQLDTPGEWLKHSGYCATHDPR